MNSLSCELLLEVDNNTDPNRRGCSSVTAATSHQRVNRQGSSASIQVDPVLIITFWSSLDHRLSLRQRNIVSLKWEEEGFGNPPILKELKNKKKKNKEFNNT